ncbi:MAG: bifunctional UDP-N-acetylglucosamine diphosphorylase/glucosamine-1-phosphate N-acetyltransferase GlmU [Armatimonadetes bacterium]|nr:bifunctional UDP-N-acetylglucosamine diphosphorylase/glucosamine-1-phosphate N-acetyltransferase GlmU [Armatimonadota bacterium]
MRPVAAVVLAAGEGTRMKSDLPKPLIAVCGRPMLFHVVDELLQAGVEKVVVVVGARREQVVNALSSYQVEVVVQDPPRGTGHAVLCAETAFRDFDGDLLVTYADVPLLRAETLRKLLDTHRATGSAATVLTAFYDNPTGYGRIVRDASGRFCKIVEEKEASDDIRAIREINTGVSVFDARPMFAALKKIKPSAVKGELYLTDAIEILAREGHEVIAIPADDSTEVLGINDRIQLAQAEAIARQRVREQLMREGVTMLDPASTFIDAGVLIGRDTVLYPGVHILGQSSIGARCTIGPNAFIHNSSVGDDCTVLVGAVVRDSQVGAGCSLGPYCHVRDHSRLDEAVRIGSYAEVVRTTIGTRTRCLHFSYLGDAIVGEDVNIGAGTITCNYDGKRKHPTVIEAEAFIGSDAVLVAPVRIGQGAYVAAGSVITSDVPAGALAMARERQSIRLDWARRFRERED